MKSLFKSVIKKSILMLIIYSGLATAQQINFNKQIEQWDEDLYLVTLSDSQGDFKSYEMCYSNPDNFNFVFHEDNPSDILGKDLLVATMNMPDNTKGVKPYDVCFNPNYNKIYVYGNQRLLIINSLTKQIISTIRVSEVGDLSTAHITIFPKLKCLTYDQINDKLYCATMGRELIVIDGITNQIVTQFNMYDKVNQIGPIVKYNEVTNRIYWINNFYFQGAKVKVINPSNWSFTDIFISEGYIYDLEINLTGNLCYAAVGYGLKFINAIDFSISQSISTGQLNELIYSSSSNKIFGSLGMTNQMSVVNATNGNQYPNLELPVSDILNGCANNTNNKIYLTSGSGPYNTFKMIGVNCSNNQLLFNNYVNGAWSLLYNSNLNKVYCGGLNVMKTMSGTSNSFENSTTIEGCRSYLLTENSNNEIVSIGHFEHTLSYFSSSGNHLNTDDIGGATHLGCYNSNNNKVYFIKDFSSHINSYVSIWDGLTNSQITKIPVGEDLRDICYNSESNKVFVSALGSGLIKIISGSTDQVVQTISGVSAHLLFSFKNKVYCGTGTSIKIIHADSYQTTTISALGSSRWSAITDEENNKIYLASYEGNKIYVVDYYSNSVVYTINTSGFPEGITINPVNHKLYTSNEDGTISIYDANNYQLITTLQITDFSATGPIVFGVYSNTVYVCGLNNSLNKSQISLISGISNTATSKIMPEGWVSGMIYNPVNNTLYTHLLYSYQNLNMVIKGYDCTENNLIQLIETNNLQKPGYIGFYKDEVLIPYNSINDKFYCGSYGFANISAVKVSLDVVPLNYNWRWLSFPRMERYKNDPFSTESVLSNLNVYPAKEFTLYRGLYPDPPYNLIYKGWLLTPPPAHWDGYNLDNVQSTSGYKLYIGQSSGLQPKITLYGAKLHPETELTIAGGGTKQDLGYFIEEAQYPWQAFPPDLYYTKLTLIQAQYWTMVKDETKGDWIISGKVTPIKYGDMVIVKTNQPQPVTFQWNDPDESEEDVVLAEPQNYTWEEQPVYTPFFIETDEECDIAEIAVMVNGECMGATVREPGDTLVEVDGYLGELPVGAVVEFETWDGLKSTPVKKDGYIVFNNTTRKNEKRNIYIGEKQDYYKVSFKHGEVYDIPDDISHITCQPNPFSNETTITMRLNGEQLIWVEIYDFYGAKIKTLLEGDLPGGYYEVKWFGDNEKRSKVSKGIYFYRIRSGNGTAVSEKIVLVN